MMKHLRLSLLLPLAFVPLASSATTFLFDWVVTGGTPDGSPHWATLSFVDNGTDTVDLSLTNNAPANSTQFFSELDLNITPYAGSLALSVLSDPDNLIDGFDFDEDGVNGISGDKFDFEIDFVTAGNNPRFTTGKTVSWRITGTGLTASAFDSLTSVGNLPMKAMLHVQALADGGSSKVAPTVPEPATLALVSAGVLGLLRRRRSDRVDQR